MLARLDRDGMEVRLWPRQVQLVRQLDVRDLLEGGHQLRQIEEFGEARLCAEPRPLRGQLHRRHSFPKGGGPSVEVLEPHLLQLVVLEVPLHGIKLRHGVTDRRPRGEDDALVSRQLVHIPALHKHI